MTHLPNCTCAAHARINVQCKCHGFTFTTHGSLSSHLRSARKKKPKRSILIPDGLDFLEAVALSKEHGHEYNLSVLRQFSAALHPPGSRRKAFTHSHRNTLRQASECVDPLMLMPMRANLTAREVADVHRLAQSADSPPSDVLALLVRYGFMYMVQGMRSDRAAPAAYNPTIKDIPTKTTPAQDTAGVAPTEQVTVYVRSDIPNEHKRTYKAPRTGSDEA